MYGILPRTMGLLKMDSLRCKRTQDDFVQGEKRAVPTALAPVGMTRLFCAHR